MAKTEKPKITVGFDTEENDWFVYENGQKKNKLELNPINDDDEHFSARAGNKQFLICKRTGIIAIFPPPEDKKDAIVGRYPISFEGENRPVLKSGKPTYDFVISFVGGKDVPYKFNHLAPGGMEIIECKEDSEKNITFIKGNQRATITARDLIDAIHRPPKLLTLYMDGQTGMVNMLSDKIKDNFPAPKFGPRIVRPTEPPSIP